MKTKEKKGFDYYLEDDILKGYEKKSIKMRLEWLYQMNKFRMHYPKEIIESHEKYRKGEI